jgi:hypothetical protein
MNWYKKAQYSSLMYRGSEGAEDILIDEDFPGVFFSSDPFIAREDGPNIYVYRIKPGRYFSPDLLSPSKEECRLVMNFAKKQAIKFNIGCKHLLNFFLQNPTENWVEYLSRLGYLGYIEYDRLFLFNPNNAQYVGRYNFEKEGVA